MATQLDKIEQDVSELKAALMGDKFGNTGYMQRLEEVEEHVTEAKKRIWVERGIMIGLTIVVGIVSNLIHLVK